MIRSAPSPGPLALALLLSGLLAAACAGPGGFGTRIPEAERLAYAAALAPQPDDLAASADALEAFVATYPRSLLADDAMEELARIDFIEGGREAAFARLRETILRYPTGDRSDSIRLRLALWESQGGDLEGARRQLNAVRPAGLSLAERRFFYRLRVRLAPSDGERLIDLARLRGVTAELYAEQAGADGLLPDASTLSDDVSQLDREIDALMASLSGEDLLRAIPKLGTAVPAARVRLVLSWRSLVGGDLPLATFWLEEAGRYPMTSSDRERMKSLAMRLGTGEGEADDHFLPTFREAASRSWPELDGLVLRVGVVLPLSGRYAPFGEEALRGLLLAAGAFDVSMPEPMVVPVQDELEQFLAERIPAPPGVAPEPPAAAPEAVLAPPAPGIELVVRDSGGSSERAAAAVRELAADPEVLAIVGPIFSAESEAAAREAQRLGIPLLTLSNRPQLSSERPFVFRLRMTPADEIDRLVEYAIDEAGAETFAILYPMSRYGRGMRSLYWDAVVSRGGTVVAAAGYEPEATDFNAPIRGMVGFDLITPNERVALQERSRALRRGRRLEPQASALLKEILYTQLGPDGEPLPPQVDFDALFIPDGHDKIQLIAPQLAFHEIEGVQLLGSSDWNDPELIEIGREHVVGALVSTRFHVESEFEIVKNFSTDYRESFGSDPDEFSASAFDALNIALTQVSLGYGTRLEIRDGIQRIYGFPGVSGVTSILPDGNARKRPFLVEVRRRRFMGID